MDTVSMLPPFELSLDEYAALWKPVSYEEELPGGNGSGRDAPVREYVQRTIARWANTQDDAQVVHSLLEMALSERGDSNIEIACLMEAAQICARHGMLAEARLLCATCFTRRSEGAPPPDVRAFYRELIGPASSIALREATQSFNPLSSQDEHLVRCLLSDWGASELSEDILKASQATIILKTREVPIGRPITTRLGGVPDVEEGWQWPDNLEFLAQLNLEELSPYDINNLLPKQGLLRFFMRNLAYGGWEGDGSRVEFYRGDLSRLHSAEAPEFFMDLRVTPDQSYDDCIYKEVELEGVASAEVDFANSSSSVFSEENLYEARKKSQCGHQWKRV